MNEIISINSDDSDIERGSTEIEELKIFPDSIRTLIDKLPDVIKNKIFPKLQKEESAVNKSEGESSLEDLISTFDVTTREEYLTRCLIELFSNGNFRDRLLTNNEENLEQEVKSLLDLLWRNRGKQENIVLFNQKYYEDFFRARQIITGEIAAKKQAVEELKKSIAITKKQRRLTERKREDLRKIELEIDTLLNELNTFDNQHGNSNLDHLYFRDISSRQKNEREWTMVTAITCEYLDATEFATIMAEQLERTFHQEFSIIKSLNNNQNRGNVSDSQRARAQNIVQSVYQATETWHATQQSEECFKKPSVTKSQERQAKLINHLTDLMASYSRGKKRGSSNNEMTVTIRQIEVTLTILGK